MHYSKAFAPDWLENTKRNNQNLSHVIGFSIIFPIGFEIRSQCALRMRLNFCCFRLSRSCARPAELVLKIGTGLKTTPVIERNTDRKKISLCEQTINDNPYMSGLLNWVWSWLCRECYLIYEHFYFKTNLITCPYHIDLDKIRDLLKLSDVMCTPNTRSLISALVYPIWCLFMQSPSQRRHSTPISGEYFRIHSQLKMVINQIVVFFASIDPNSSHP